MATLGEARTSPLLPPSLFLLVVVPQGPTPRAGPARHAANHGRRGCPLHLPLLHLERGGQAPGRPSCRRRARKGRRLCGPKQAERGSRGRRQQGLLLVYRACDVLQLDDEVLPLHLEPLELGLRLVALPVRVLPLLIEVREFVPQGRELPPVLRFLPVEVLQGQPELLCRVHLLPLLLLDHDLLIQAVPVLPVSPQSPRPGPQQRPEGVRLDQGGLLDLELDLLVVAPLAWVHHCGAPVPVRIHVLPRQQRGRKQG
mmetsp:Transcript_5910/g.21173  ORF Transcript_5910/g.21173 Transcript_5910/m.21173 type:complete len:256 (-) Transcript_5910:1394-2161(-)